MQSVELQAFTYEERQGLLPALTTTVSHCGAWILDRKTLSPTSMELRLEIQLRFIMDLYATLLAAGIELSRVGHQNLADLCTCLKHLKGDVAQVVTIRIEITFLEDLTLHTILMSGASAA